MTRTLVADTSAPADAPPAPRSARRVRLAAALCAVGTASVYLVGSARAFDYDESVSIARFIRTRSLWAPLTRQVVFNNHVAFSFVEHLVYVATGSASETTMRALPIAFAAATVGLIVLVLARVAPLPVAVTGGLLLAANPLFVGVSRQARGYSLLCLCALASTALLLSLRRKPSRARAAGYVGLVALGLATHVYMLLIVGAHVVILARHRELTAAWRRRVLTGVVLGAAAYLGVVAAMVRSAGTRPRTLHPGFPLDLVRALSGTAWPAVAVVGVGTIVTMWAVRARVETRPLVAFFAVALVVVWLVVAPYDLYPRFFVWACPAVAAAAAIGLLRLRPAALAASVVAVALIAMMVASTPGYASDALVTREAAALVRPITARGGAVCGIGASTETLAVYLPHVHEVNDPAGFLRCDVAIAVEPGDNPRLVTQALRVFPHHRWLAAGTPGLVLWSTPR